MYGISSFWTLLYDFLFEFLDICGRGEKIVDLYQFGQTEEICLFNSSGIGKIHKVHFDPYGIRLGGCNSKGDLNIWKFDNVSDMKPHIFIDNAHSSSISDFSFLNSPNLIASNGMNSSPSLCLWDLLLPLESACVFSMDNLDSCGVMTYCNSLNLLCIGGQKGKIITVDLRSKKILHLTQAHSVGIKSLIVSGCMLYSGSRSGEVKAWDLTQMESVGHHFNLGTHIIPGHYSDAALILGGSHKNFDMHLLGDAGYLATSYEKTLSIWEQPVLSHN